METNLPLAKQMSLIKRKHDDILILNNPNITQYIHTKPNQPGLYPYFITLNPTNTAPFTNANYLDCNVAITNNTFANTKPIINKYNNLNLHQLRAQCAQHKLKIGGHKHELLLRLNQRTNINHYHNKPYIWTTKTYNKKDSFPPHIHPITYPMFHSNTALHSKTGTITGTLHTFLTTNSHYAQHFTNAATQLLTKLITHNQYPKHTIRKTLYRFLSSRTFPYRESAKSIIHHILHLLPP